MRTVGHITPWGVHCGIAKHLSYWLPKLRRPSVIYAEDPPPWYTTRETWGTWPQERIWQRGAPGALTRIVQRAAKDGAGILHLQWDPGFFAWQDVNDAKGQLDLHEIKLIVTAHCLVADRPWTLPNKAMLRAVDRLAVGTPAMVEAFTKYAAGFQITLRAPVAHVPLPHAPGASGLRRAVGDLSEAVILTWGMLGSMKGHTETLEAVRFLRGNGCPGARYIVMGRALTGEQRRNLETLREHAATDPAALEIYEGFHTDEDIIGACRQADVIVLNHQADYASSSGTIATSVASGTPVVVSRSRMFSGYEGAVAVAEPGTEGLAKTIDAVLHRRADRDWRYFRVCARTAPSSVARAYEDIYKELDQ